MQRIDFGKWIPDGDPKVGDMVECAGVIPYDGKLNVFPTDNNMSATAISGTVAKLMFNTLDPSSTNKTFVCTNDKVYRLDTTTMTDVSISGGYSIAAANTWDWCVYGDNVILASLSDHVQKLSDIDGGANFAKLAGNTVTDTTIAFVNSNPDTITDSNNGLGGFTAGDRILVSGSTGGTNDGEFTIATVAAGTLTLVATDTLTAQGASPSVTIKDIPLKSACCAMYKDHLFLGNQTGNERRLQISATGEITDFAATTATGAGTIDLPGWGESIVCLKPIGDYLAVYMTRSIYLISFIGAPLWFSAHRIHEGDGAMSIHSVAQVDKNVHAVLGNNDIFLLSGNQVQPIGAGVRRRVIDAIDLSKRHLITHSVGRSKKVVMWAYPSTSGDGTPDKIVIYNYEENRFSEIAYNVHCIASLLSPSITINAMDSYFATIDDVNESFDSSFWKGEGRLNGVITDTNKKVASFTGTASAATIETGEVDMEDVHQIRRLRPIIQKAAGTVTGTVKHRFDDDDDYTSTSDVMGTDGLCDLRATGRYHKIRLAITGEHDGLRGCKLDTVKTGGR